MSYISTGGGAGGAGTVTNTGGALTANAVVLGAGGNDEKVLASLGTTTTLLHGNAAGAPTFGAVALTTDVSGVLPPANGGVAVVSAAGLGYFVSDGRIFGPEGWTTSAQIISAVADQVKVTQFVMPIIATVTRVSVTITGAVAGTCNMGIYDAAGTTKLIDSGNFNSGSATTQTLTISSVTLNPGIYWFAAACSNTTATIASFTNTAGTPTFQLWNALTVRVGTAANSSAGGLPATLGVITGTAINLPIAFFQFA